MVRSRLPLPSFLRFFGPLLMLFAELLLGSARRPYDLHITHRKVQKALGFAVEQYNKNTGDSTNYFKYLSLVNGYREVKAGTHYYFKVVLVETTCAKKARKMRYKDIQKCQALPGNKKKRTCQLKVVRPRLSFKMKLVKSICV